MGDARHADVDYEWAGGLEDGCERMMDGVCFVRGVDIMMAPMGSTGGRKEDDG